MRHFIMQPIVPFNDVMCEHTVATPDGSVTANTSDAGSTEELRRSHVTRDRTISVRLKMERPLKRLTHPLDRSALLSLITGCSLLLAGVLILAPFLVLLVTVVPLALLLKYLMKRCSCCWCSSPVAPVLGASLAAGDTSIVDASRLADSTSIEMLQEDASLQSICENDTLDVNRASFPPSGCCRSERFFCTDALWLHDTPLNHNVMSALLKLEPSVELSRLRGFINSRLFPQSTLEGSKKIKFEHHSKYHRLYSQVVELPSGLHVWRPDAQFDIRRHIYPVTLPNDTHKCDADLQGHLSELMFTQFPAQHPLWDMQVFEHCSLVNNADNDAASCTLLLVRVHRSVTDGMGLLRLFLRELTDQRLSTNSLLKARYAHSAFYFNLCRAILTAPLYCIYKSLIRRPDKNAFKPMHSGIDSSALRVSGQKLMRWSAPFSLARAVRVKRVTRCTLNDVLLSVLAGCLRHALRKRTGEVNPANMLASIVVDFRDDGRPDETAFTAGASGAANASSSSSGMQESTINSAEFTSSSRRASMIGREHHVTLGTQSVYLDIELPVSVEGAIPRLWEIRTRMDEIKSSSEAVSMYLLQRLLSAAFPARLARRIMNAMYSGSTLGVANLPGTEQTISLNGSDVTQLLVWQPSPTVNQALSIGFSTCNGELRMSVAADSCLGPELPELLCQHFIFQMESLSELLINRRIPGEHAVRRVDCSLKTGRRKSSIQPPSINELQLRMTNVQKQLLELKSHVTSVSFGSHMSEEEEVQLNEEQRALLVRVDSLKDEFRDLLIELKHRKAVDGILSDDQEEDADSELRRWYQRRRTLSAASRRSVVSLNSVQSSTTNSATSSGASHSLFGQPGACAAEQRRACDRLRSPSIPCGAVQPSSNASLRPFHTVHHPPSARHSLTSLGDSFLRTDGGGGGGGTGAADSPRQPSTVCNTEATSATTITIPAASNTSSLTT